MSLPHFFIDRPIFATVMSTAIVLVGALAYGTLPVAQFPDVAPPTVVVAASYPGASPDVIARTVSTPLEQQINGVEGMIYMSSQSTNDGAMTITVSFELGTDLDTAQVQVQNRVATALPALPEDVRRIGVVTQKQSPDLLLVGHLVSPDHRYNRLYISNYAFLQVRDALARIEGVGDVAIFGAREYSMRVWLDPQRLAALDLTSSDVLAALREQNLQVAAGVIGQQPAPTDSAFQLSVGAQGRLEEPEEFGRIVVRTTEDGSVVRVEDVARVELGALDYSLNSYLDGEEAVAIAVRQRPGSNALATARAVEAELGRLAESFPPGLEHRIVYNPTTFIQQSIDEVIRTIFEAVILVVIVVLVFLQSFRATFIPLAAIPVSLIGTFAVMAGFGFSLNNLTLFGLVLAIGIVVDDAIVVVENVERNIENGLEVREACRRAMTELTGALVSTSLVLVAVFVPTAFLSGITGQFYRQFALTIAVSTVISSLVSLTLSPAMARVFLKSQAQMQAANRRSLWERISGPFFRWFNRRFAQIESAYDTFVCRAVRSPLPTVLLFLVVIGATVLIFTLVPPGFIPPQDQGYLIAALQLPDGASLSRTDEVTQEVTRISLETPGVQHAVAFAGFNGATFSNSANSGAVFVTLAPFAERRAAGLTLDSIMGELRQRYSSILGAGIFVIQPPSVTGLGTGGGFKMMVQDRGNAGFVRLQQEVNEILGAAYQTPDLVGVFSPFRATTPRLFVDVDRTRAKMLDVPIDGIFATLQTYLGSAYVNDFNFLGRTYRVTAQAEPTYRDEAEDITRLRTRSRSGAVVPLGSVAEVERRVGPDRVVRYNLYPAAEINGNPAPGRSTGEALAIMERIAAETLDPSFDYEWTELAFQEQEAASPVPIFLLCILFVFLTLAAQYESWVLPIAILLIVPVSLFGGILGTLARAMDNNILTQVGFVVLIGLAAKNAILIVEFARQLEDEGRSRWDAAIEASRLRLRPILMTSFAFVLGVLPLAIATGAGAEMRQALGTAVLFGMLGVTFFALLFTPVAYVLVRSAAERLTGGERAEAGDCDDRTPGGRSDAGGSGRVGSGRGGSDGGTAVDGNAVDDDLAEGASADLSRPGPDDPAAIDLDRDPGPAGSPAPQPTS